MNAPCQTLIIRSCTSALLLAMCASVAAQAEAPKLAPAYEGSWDNLEGPVTNNMRITIDKVDPDGTVQGTYARFARHCAAKGIPMKGKLVGTTLELVPDFGTDVNCKDTTWTFQVQPDGKLVGLGQSYFRLKAELKPVAK
jgi:hypothetical protein